MATRIEKIMASLNARDMKTMFNLSNPKYESTKGLTENERQTAENVQPKRPRENNDDWQTYKPSLNTLQYVDLYDQGNWEKLQSILDKPFFEHTSKKIKLQSDAKLNPNGHDPTSKTPLQTITNQTKLHNQDPMQSTPTGSSKTNGTSEYFTPQCAPIGNFNSVELSNISKLVQANSLETLTNSKSPPGLSPSMLSALEAVPNGHDPFQHDPFGNFNSVELSNISKLVQANSLETPTNSKSPPGLSPSMCSALEFVLSLPSNESVISSPLFSETHSFKSTSINKTCLFPNQGSSTNRYGSDIDLVDELSRDVLPLNSETFQYPIQITAFDHCDTEADNMSMDNSEDDKLMAKLSSKKRVRRNDRRNFCIFCETLVLQLRRHMINNHKDETVVKEYLGLFEFNAEQTRNRRNQIMADLTAQGNHRFNSRLLDVQGKEVSPSDLLPSRRPPKNKVIQPHLYVSCTICHCLFVKKHFYNHAAACKKKYEEKQGENVENSTENINNKNMNINNNDDEIESYVNEFSDNRRIMYIKEYGIPFCHKSPGASEKLIKNIFPILRKDGIGIRSMKDPLLLCLASDFYESHNLLKDRTQVTRKLRDGAILVKEVNKLDSSVNTLSDIFNPSIIGKVITSCQNLCKIDTDSIGHNRNEAVIGMNARLSWVLIEGGKRLMDNIISDMTLTDDQKKVKKQSVKDFLEVLKRRWKYYISSNSEKMRRRQKILKEVIMPADEDIIKLAGMLRDMEIDLLQKLSKTVTKQDYDLLCKVTIAHILTLNRRRPFEATNSEFELYQRKKNTNYYSEKVLKTLAVEEKLSLQELASYIVPAKGKEAMATILLTKNMEKCIDLIIKCRRHFSMEDNPLLFPRPGLITPYDGSKVIRDMVEMCPNLSKPKHLTCTGLRHHVATLGHIKGPEFTSTLSQFMCHSDAVHNKNYVAPIEMVHKAVIGTYLTSLEGTSLDQNSVGSQRNPENAAGSDETALIIPHQNDSEYIEGLQCKRKFSFRGKQRSLERNNIHQNDDAGNTDPSFIPSKYNIESSTDSEEEIKVEEKRRISVAGKRPWTAEEKSDSCCNPLSLGAFKKFLEQEIPNVYVKSIKIGNNIIEDTENGFFKNVNKQVEMVCQQLAEDTELADGYNAIGFSQGSQFLRAVAQKCPSPRMYNLISMGGQHQGVFGLPHCFYPTVKVCDYVRRLLNVGAYWGWVQDSLVQAEYWHDPLDEAKYRKKSAFIAEINNEQTLNTMYKQNLLKLNNLVLVKFLNDTMIQPKESSWFEFYTPGQDVDITPLNQSEIYLKDYLGLKTLDESNRLHFLSVEGDHLRFTEAWFKSAIIDKYLV